MRVWKALRRSIKGEKDGGKPHVSIAPKSALAIVPPKKVCVNSQFAPEAKNPHPSPGRHLGSHISKPVHPGLCAGFWPKGSESMMSPERQPSRPISTHREDPALGIRSWTQIHAQTKA